MDRSLGKCGIKYAIITEVTKNILYVSTYLINIFFRISRGFCTYNVFNQFVSVDFLLFCGQVMIGFWD